jgi:hypothetical protein
MLRHNTDSATPFLCGILHHWGMSNLSAKEQSNL